jgi:DNA-binding XRE family transcriptional regulator
VNLIATQLKFAALETYGSYSPTKPFFFHVVMHRLGIFTSTKQARPVRIRWWNSSQGTSAANMDLSVSDNVVLMLCSMYAIYMSRNQEEPVYNRIEEARLAHGLSRQELADKVGVHYQTIGYLERGEYSPSLALSLRLAKLLKQEVSELFSLTPFKKGK